VFGFIDCRPPCWSIIVCKLDSSSSTSDSILEEFDGHPHRNRGSQSRQGHAQASQISAARQVNCHRIVHAELKNREEQASPV
jgi:hypothetical protein